jgi:hypothetical protein
MLLFWDSGSIYLLGTRSLLVTHNRLDAAWTAMTRTVVPR